jgi:hypothetical protein
MFAAVFGRFDKESPCIAIIFQIMHDEENYGANLNGNITFTRVLLQLLANIYQAEFITYSWQVNVWRMMHSKWFHRTVAITVGTVSEKWFKSRRQNSLASCCPPSPKVTFKRCRFCMNRLQIRGKKFWRFKLRTEIFKNFGRQLSWPFKY